MPGYSGTPLAKKLGIKEGHVVALFGAPKGFEATLEGLPAGATVKRSPRTRGPFDVVVYMPKDAAEYRARLRSMVALTRENGAVWACWPKKASGVVSDVTETLIRETALASGVVDVKVCAVSDVYAGQKLVRRLKDRAGTRA
ncbi:MAG: DUF3052 domain-containing protein [Phycisphaerae bacterium]|nr:DUF3052 domain-containing protein [Phycisphaerae bacterium]